MKILITGKNGQLGFELQRSLMPLGVIVATDHTTCNLTQPESIRTTIRSMEPDIIVNAAAYTAVDRAESNKELAYAVNDQALKVIGEEAAMLGAYVIHYSTDYVFDGSKHGAYEETDRPNPLNVYGRSKLAGERALEDTGAKYLILRTSWVAGAHGGNFIKSILRLAAERDTLNVIADQHGSPTSAALIADVTAHVVKELMRRKANKQSLGIFHLTAGGSTTWHEYASFVVKSALAAGASIKLKPEKIFAITTAEYPTAAQRPMNSCLSTARFRDEFGLTLPDWRDGVNHIFQQLYK